MSPLLVLTPLTIERFAVSGKLRRSTVRSTGMGRAHAQRFAAELRGAGAVRVLESAKPLARAVESLGLRAHLGPILSVDRLAGAEERDALAAASGAVAVDMESAWLGALADTKPFAVLRVVSDGPGNELFGPRILVNGLRALRALRAASPALELWAENHGHSLEERS